MSTAVAEWERFSKQKATKWLLCIAGALGAIAMLGSTGIVFALLLLLMLTGMPISIALGLTVLSFLFFFTDIPPNREIDSGRSNIRIGLQLEMNMRLGRTARVSAKGQFFAFLYKCPFFNRKAILL